MNKFLKLMVALTAVLAAQAAWAQKGTAIDILFRYDGHLDNEKTVLIKGRELKSYNLTLFRSRKYKSTDLLETLADDAIAADAKDAAIQEIERASGRIVYALISYGEQNGINRFFCYRIDASGTATAVYMEGKTSLRELRKIIEKH